MSPECMCGELATVSVRIDWQDGPQVYLYCPDCAEAAAYAIKGAEILA